MTVPSGGFDPRRAPDVNIPGPDLRKMEISEFGDWLRTQTSKQHLPYQETAIHAYTEVAGVLDRWMTEKDIDGDFTACDTALLIRFFADYRKSHTQGGTNTRQRILHHLFKWLAKVHGHPDPWTEDLVRYGPADVPPSTLSRNVITDKIFTECPVVSPLGRAYADFAQKCSVCVYSVTWAAHAASSPSWLASRVKAWR